MYIAHENQQLLDHLQSVATLCRKNAAKIGCDDYGELLSLLHDLGKYSKNFQDYIQSATGILDPDIDDDFVETLEMKGKIDHSTAGAQFIWERLSAGTPIKRLTAQILSLCLVSHHSGIIDCITTDSQGTYDSFTKRIMKSEVKTHFAEVLEKSKTEIGARIEALVSKHDFEIPMKQILQNIFVAMPEKKQQSLLFQFQKGLLLMN